MSAEQLLGEVERSYAAVREALEASVLPGSPLDHAMREWLTDHSLPPSLLLPIAAAGGPTRASVRLASGLGHLLLAMRWLDDLVDADRDGQLWQRHGVGGAAVLASSALTHAWATLSAETALPRTVLTEFGDTTAVLALGEAMDQRTPPRTIAQWQAIAWRKTAVCYRFAVWAGAVLTRDGDWVQAAPRYGTQLGLYLQAADDIAGCFGQGAPDLHRGTTLTLPLVELLSERPDRAALFERRDVVALQSVLAEHDVHRRCLRRAAGYAASAAAVLRSCPGPWTDSCDGFLAALCEPATQPCESSADGACSLHLDLEPVGR
ncbi:MAG TPA: polyprenyl synthetase family protein [Motilibacterales bacterium]|nr:polyprenyl synthetase family protein [Motilibacterales bacterium]